MRIRTLIVDDMALARRRLRRHLEPVPEVDIVGEATGGEEAIALIRSLKPDLVVLDVQMPEVDGFDVMEEVGPAAVPAVIFVTAYDQFALRAFEIHAIDYLLKPFDAARLRKAIERVRKVLDREAPAANLRALLDEMARPERRRGRLAIRADGRTVLLQLDEIDYIEAAGNYLRIQAGSESFMIREKISRMEERLGRVDFVRIHRSTIVNATRVKEIHPLFNGDQSVVLTDGKRLTMSRTYREGALLVLAGGTGSNGDR